MPIDFEFAILLTAAKATIVVVTIERSIIIG